LVKDFRGVTLPVFPVLLRAVVVERVSKVACLTTRTVATGLRLTLRELLLLVLGVVAEVRSTWGLGTMGRVRGKPVAVALLHRTLLERMGLQDLSSFAIR